MEGIHIQTTETNKSQFKLFLLFIKYTLSKRLQIIYDIKKIIKVSNPQNNSLVFYQGNFILKRWHVLRTRTKTII